LYQNARKIIFWGLSGREVLWCEHILDLFGSKYHFLKCVCKCHQILCQVLYYLDISWWLITKYTYGIILQRDILTTTSPLTSRNWIGTFRTFHWKRMEKCFLFGNIFPKPNIFLFYCSTTWLISAWTRNTSVRESTD
jgi:hypothetical protein